MTVLERRVRSHRRPSPARNRRAFRRASRCLSVRARAIPGPSATESGISTPVCGRLTTSGRIATAAFEPIKMVSFMSRPLRRTGAGLRPRPRPRRPSVRARSRPRCPAGGNGPRRVTARRRGPGYALARAGALEVSGARKSHPWAAARSSMATTAIAVFGHRRQPTGGVGRHRDMVLLVGRRGNRVNARGHRPVLVFRHERGRGDLRDHEPGIQTRISGSGTRAARKATGSISIAIRRSASEPISQIAMAI